MTRWAIVTAAGAMLASCSVQDGDAAAVGGLTAAESAQLEAAAERLDARPPSPRQAQSKALEAQSRTELEAQRREMEAR